MVVRMRKVMATPHPGVGVTYAHFAFNFFTLLYSYSVIPINRPMESGLFFTRSLLEIEHSNQNIWSSVFRYSNTLFFSV